MSVFKPFWSCRVSLFDIFACPVSHHILNAKKYQKSCVKFKEVFFKKCLSIFIVSPEKFRQRYSIHFARTPFAVRCPPFAVRRPRHISRTVRPTGLKLGGMKGFGFGVRSETFGGVVKVIKGQKVI